MSRSRPLVLGRVNCGVTQALPLDVDVHSRARPFLVTHGACTDCVDLGGMSLLPTSAAACSGRRDALAPADR